MNNVKEAFGESADLYSVLGLTNRDDAEDNAKLRKAYFRKALVYHPDKTKEKNAAVAKAKFQAISFAYQVLKNPEKRAEYNETGQVDEEHDDDDDDAMDNKSTKSWKDYFDLIFGKLTTSKIDQFALKYKCSEEEQRDVLEHYKKLKGDINKMLEYVMLSSPVDCKRWLEDYIKPAIEEGKVPDYADMIQKSMKKVEKKIEKEQKKQQQQQEKKKAAAKSSNKSKSSKKENQDPASDEDEEEEDEDYDEDDDDEVDAEEMTDEDATETESEEEEEPTPPPKKSGSKKKAPATNSNKKKAKQPAARAKPTKAKATNKKKKSKEDDLVAMIRGNQAKRSGGAFFADMAARYGAKMDEDPLGDEEFDKIQSRLKKKKRAR